MPYIGANMVESLSNSDLDYFKLYILTLNTETLVSKSKYWIYFKKDFSKDMDENQVK